MNSVEMPMEVPEVVQLPELSGEENPGAFAAMVLTTALGYGNAILTAEYLPGTLTSGISWVMRPLDKDWLPGELEIACSPSLDSFRAVLTHFGGHYLNEMVNGHTALTLRQRGKAQFCHIYMANSAQTGFWIRICVA